MMDATKEILPKKEKKKGTPPKFDPTRTDRNAPAGSPNSLGA
jgi:hypothetical protein